MSLSLTQLQRVAQLERCQERLGQLSRLAPAQLRALLGGEPRKVADWIESAAECGLPAAQLSFGRMLLEGWGVPRHPARAVGWFARAAGHGDSEALNMLGRCHENGWGTPVDLARAAGCYRDSAQTGYDWGQYNWANLLFEGRGVTRDLSQAMVWYWRAAAQDHSRAMNLLGRCLEEGWGCAANREEAAYWYRRSAECGYFRGQFNHASALLQSGQGAAAAPWFARAASAGNGAMRRAIAAALAGASDPALLAVRAQCDPWREAMPSAR